MSITDILRTARGEIGYTRWNDPEQGSKYGRWYAKDHGAYYGTSGVPYCAMFVSWVYDQCPGDDIPGGYKAYVPYFINEARNAGALRTFSQAQPGDLICFDWDADGIADHVGIVEEAPVGATITTIEGNTSPGSGGSQSNGGGVWRRQRYAEDVCAIIRTSHNNVEPVHHETLLERISRMNATHVFFESGGRMYCGDILAGTYSVIKDPQTLQDRKTVLTRCGAIVKSWGEFSGSKTDHVDNPAAFGKEV